ncbi:hypothetical protein Daus18300_004257 [Diaporthe australafricana]|uniref:Aminoglycoside phosphotransferase domain-containing protein n=1 Tax=Diaporthe australafricana TaxID=127596 RepID=A0ABR3XAE4_9PEZI
MKSECSMTNCLPSLPQIPGPKLSHFTPDAHAEITFIKAIGSSDDQDSQFEFCNLRYLKNVLAKNLTQPLASSQAYVDYYDPFNCECRAYGRLAQEGRADLAVLAHGYLLLTPQQEAEVTPMITGGLEYEPDDQEPLGTLDGESSGADGKSTGDNLSELVEDDSLEVAFNTGRVSASTMWRDLEDLHSLGILMRDIHIGNYIGGRLVDFSRAWTMYHPGLDRIHPRNLARFRMLDTHGLLVMLQDWWVATPGVNEMEIPESLHNCDAGGNDYGTDPRGYDWLRWEEDGEAAAAYVKRQLFTKDIEAPE